jgi:tetratricopeptide (TPR) repeat protein
MGDGYKYCIFCGARIKESANFCPSCGERAATESTTQPIAEILQPAEEHTRSKQSWQPAEISQPVEEETGPEPQTQPMTEIHKSVEEDSKFPKEQPHIEQKTEQKVQIQDKQQIPVRQAQPADERRIPEERSRKTESSQPSLQTAETSGGSRWGPPTTPQWRPTSAPKKKKKPRLALIFIIAGAIVIIAAAALALIVFDVFGIFGGGKSAEPKAAEILSLGEQYLQDSDYEQAIEYFEQLIVVEPKIARGYTGLAEAYIGLDEMSRALDALERGLENTDGSLVLRRALEKLESEGSADGTANPSAPTATPDIETIQNVIVLRIGDPNMVVNGTTTRADANGGAPFTADGASMIPLRGVLEVMGGGAEYDADVGSVRAEFDGHIALITTDSAIAYIDGEAVRLPAAPTSRDGSLYVPAKLFSDAFGAELAWFANTQSVSLTYTGPEIDASVLPPTA